MTDRVKKNFKVGIEDWRAAMAKTEQMRRDGYVIDMTAVLEHRVVEFAGETAEETALRMGLQKRDTPVATPWRDPHRRPLEVA